MQSFITPHLAIDPILGPFGRGSEFLQLHSRQALQGGVALAACSLCPEGEEQRTVAGEENLQAQFLKLISSGHDGYDLHSAHLCDTVKVWDI